MYLMPFIASAEYNKLSVTFIKHAVLSEENEQITCSALRNNIYLSTSELLNIVLVLNKAVFP